MREKDYLARLTRTARWRLPTKEADDIIEDYTELLMIDFRPYEDLCRDYGTPKYAVRQLSFFRDYGRWLVTFWVLAAFLALPALGLFVPMPTISFLYGWQEALLLFLSLVLSIAWFRLEGVRFRERPDQLPLLMVVLILTGLSTAMLAQALFREVPLEVRLGGLLFQPPPGAGWLCLYHPAAGHWGLLRPAGPHRTGQRTAGGPAVAGPVHGGAHRCVPDGYSLPDCDQYVHT